jgi:hypothetical protein
LARAPPCRAAGAADPVSAGAEHEIIRVIIGTVPGGAIDPYARMIAEHMSRTLGQLIIVENKPGASGTLAAEYIANAPADGTILWLGTQAFTEINPNAFPKARWSIDQFRPIIPAPANSGDITGNGTDPGAGGCRAPVGVRQQRAKRCRAVEPRRMRSVPAGFSLRGPPATATRAGRVCEKSPQNWPLRPQ